MTGPEIMIQAFIKLLGIDPKQIWEGFEDIRVRVLTFDERLSRFEAQQGEILAMLTRLRDDGAINGQGTRTLQQASGKRLEHGNAKP